MSTKGQSCGECKHWLFICEDKVEGREGACTSPIPDSVADCYTYYMFETDGTTCPVFKRGKQANVN